MSDPTRQGTRRVLILAAILLTLVAWTSLPPSRVSLDESCRPAGLRAQVSRVLWQAAFWRAQQAALADERERVLHRMSHPEENEDSPAIESRMLRLSEPERTADAEQRQHLAEQLRLRRQERYAWLVSCQARIAAEPKEAQ